MPMQLKPAAKILLLAAFAMVLWLLSRKFSVHRSERFYLLVPVVWLSAEVLFRERHLPAVGGGRALGFVIVAVLVVFLSQSTASLIGGRISWRERLVTLYACLAMWILLRAAYAVTKTCAFAMLGRPRSGALFAAAWGLVGLSFVAVFFPYIFTALQIHRPKISNASDPKSVLGLAFERVEFRAADGVKIRGWFIPCMKSKTTVIMCHGLGANSANFLPSVPVFHSAGYNVLTFDFRGHGDSEGHTSSFGYFERLDVEGAVDYLKGRSDGRGENIICYGPSMGGAAIIHAAAEDERIAVVIADCAFADIYDMTADQFGGLPFFIRRWMTFAASVFGRLELGVTPEKLSPRRVVARISPRPILIIHGTGDRLVPYTQSQELFNAARKPKELWLVPDAGHYGAMWADPDEYQERVCNFISRYLP